MDSWLNVYSFFTVLALLLTIHHGTKSFITLPCLRITHAFKYKEKL